MEMDGLRVGAQLHSDMTGKLASKSRRKLEIRVIKTLLILSMRSREMSTSTGRNVITLPLKAALKTVNHACSLIARLLRITARLR